MKIQERKQMKEAERTAYATPVASVRETGDGYRMQAEMPGVGKEGLEITIDHNEMTIVGRRSDSLTGGDPVHTEIRRFDYRRVFELDPSIDSGKITAKIDQGLLTVTFPRAERSKPRKIEVTG